MNKQNAKQTSAGSSESKAYSLINRLRTARLIVTVVVWFIFGRVTDYLGIYIQYYGTQPPISFADILSAILVAFVFTVCEILVRKKYSLPKLKLSYAFSKQELWLAYIILILELSEGVKSKELFRKLLALFGVGE